MIYRAGQRRLETIALRASGELVTAMVGAGLLPVVTVAAVLQVPADAPLATVDATLQPYVSGVRTLVVTLHIWHPRELVERAVANALRLAASAVAE